MPHAGSQIPNRAYVYLACIPMSSHPHVYPSLRSMHNIRASPRHRGNAALLRPHVPVSPRPLSNQ